jgi:hypothetical protein
LIQIKTPSFFYFQGRRSSGGSGGLNTQYLRKALAEVANMQEDVKSVTDIKCVKDIKSIKDIKGRKDVRSVNDVKSVNDVNSVKDVRSVNDIIIDDFEDDDDESVTQVTTKRHSLKLIPE